MKDLRENLPVFTVILITVALARLLVYYDYFGINIISYIDFSEAFVLSAPVFVLLAFCLLILAVVTLMIRNPHKKQMSDSLDLSQTTIAQRIKISHSIFYYYSLLFIYLPAIVISLSLAAYRGNWTREEFSIGLYVLIFVITYDDFLISEVRYRMLNSRFTFDESNVRMYIQIIILLYFLLFSARFSAYKVIYDEYSNSAQVSMLVDGKLVSTSNLYRYIGKTKSYVFFYRLDTGHVDVYSQDDIKNFSIKETPSAKVIKVVLPSHPTPAKPPETAHAKI